MHARAASRVEISADAAVAARARLRVAVGAQRAWGAGAFVWSEAHALQLSEAATGVAGAGAGQEETPATAQGATPLGLFDGGGVQHVASPETCISDAPLRRERRIELLRALDESAVRICDRCPLCQKRTSTVFGEGDPEALLMFIGEGPGETEDRTGRPFVGRAGELLDKMIMGMGLHREQVYIANVVKCRPPNNRVPTAQEVATCTPYLHKQIEWIRPKVIVTLGLPATRHLLKTTASMGALRGRWSQWRGIKVMPTYHPAFLLRSYTDENRRIVWDDLKQVMAELGLEHAPRRAAAQRS